MKTRDFWFNAIWWVVLVGLICWLAKHGEIHVHADNGTILIIILSPAIACLGLGVAFVIVFAMVIGLTKLMDKWI